ncbi:hypothetical protein FA13DRAFT_706111 [Coprinellus micaceus]|uniref:Uncharacterized protein n=1 Tax=Coprinellus micaceus TaxID=71717 RepID=A0A4Y7TUV7_COPMI|nr:hypothetical protein FA13DRAFT_706111 [Coprinellus micaceus]
MLNAYNSRFAIGDYENPLPIHGYPPSFLNIQSDISGLSTETSEYAQGGTHSSACRETTGCTLPLSIPQHRSTTFGTEKLVAFKSPTTYSLIAMLAFIAPDTRRDTLVLRMGNSALSFELSSFLAFWRLNTSESGYQIPLWPGKYVYRRWRTVSLRPHFPLLRFVSTDIPLKSLRVCWPYFHALPRTLKLVAGDSI